MTSLSSENVNSTVFRAEAAGRSQPEVYLQVDGYGNMFSAYWKTEQGLDEMYEAMWDAHEHTIGNASVTFEENGKTNEGTSFRDFDPKKRETDFVSILTPNHTVTWELVNTNWEVGITSRDKSTAELVIELFTETTSASEVTDVSSFYDFIEDNVK